MKLYDHPMGLLHSFKQRKGMYVHPITIDTVMSFLAGIRCAYMPVYPLRGWWEAQERRGWKRVSVGPVPQMKEKGMSDEEIMDELIEIDIEALKGSEADEANFVH